MMRPSIILSYLVPIFIAAFLATLVSASIGSLSGWGFPLQWKTGGCTFINGGLTCAAETDNWLFFAADVLSYSLAGYGLLYIAYRLAPSIVARLAVLSPRIILFSTLVAAIITLATGLVLTTGQLVNPGGFSGESYGFPLAWKTSFASCPPPCIQANGTEYNWILLVGDLLFYLTAFYGSLLLALRTPRKTEILRRLESRKILGILGLAVIVFSVGNYAFDSVYGTGNHWTGYGQLGAGPLQLPEREPSHRLAEKLWSWNRDHSHSLHYQP